MENSKLEYLAASRRKIVVTARPGGSFTRGNRNTVTSAATTANFRRDDSTLEGLFGDLCVDFDRTRRLRKPGKPFEFGATKEPKLGRICPACGLTRSLSGLCDCNDL